MGSNHLSIASNHHSFTELKMDQPTERKVMKNHPEELERTPEIVEYDKSRRRVIARVVVVLAVITLVVLLFTKQAEKYFFSSSGEVHSAFVWGFWTPIASVALGAGLFLVIWYTPLFRAVRVRRKQAKVRKTTTLQ